MAMGIENGALHYDSRRHATNAPLELHYHTWQTLIACRWTDYVPVAVSECLLQWRPVHGTSLLGPRSNSCDLVGQSCLS